MTFIDPSVEEVYRTILNNDEIINFLKQENIIVTEKEIRLNYTEKEANNILPYIFANNVNTINNIAEVLVKYKKDLDNYSMEELLSNEELKKDLSNAIGISYEYLKSNVYKNIIYTYKYCYVSSFFQNNKKMFIPDNDYFELENNPMAMSFYNAMVKEFDKLDSALDKCTEYLEFDKIPWDLISYLTQLLGFEKSYFRFEDEDEKRIRTLVKSILDVYRIKGTNYSFELLFSLLGYDIKISEYYFDRRLFYSRSGSNKETDESDRREYEYYLTTSNPEKNNVDISINEIIMPSDISEQYSLKEFNELVKVYGPEVVLGYSSHYKSEDGTYKKYEGKIYKYFKTNLVYYDITLPGKNIPARKYITIGKCLDFLTPSYVTRKSSTGRGNDFDFKDTLSFNGSNEIEILDGEDFSDYGSESVFQKEDGYYYNYDGTLYQNSLKKLVPSDERKLATNKYKTPIDYKFENLSLNKYLAKGTGANYLVEKRIKYYITKKDNNNAILYPFYTVPPKVIDENNIQFKWEEKKDPVNLIGKNSIKSALKERGFKAEIPSLDDLEAFNLLEGEKMLSARDLVYSYKIKRTDEKEVPTIEDIPLEFLSLNYSTKEIYKKEELDNYYNYEDICKKLIYGKYVLGYDKTYIYICRYGNYRIPSSINGVYDYEERKKYLDSFLYEPIAISNENERTLISLNRNDEKFIQSNLENIRNDINAWRIKQINDTKISLDEITNSTYYNAEDKKYYKPIKVINPNNIKFEKNDKQFLNKEYVEDNVAYIYKYKNRKTNTIYYVKSEDKFYIVNDNLEYEELTDFYGRIEEEAGKYYIYQYDENWDGYDEEADNEDFIGYNNNHKIYWPEAGFEEERIGRPIKHLLNKELNDMTSTKDDDIFDEVYYLTFGNFSKKELDDILEIINNTFLEMLQIEKMYYYVQNFLKEYPTVFKWISPMALSDALNGKDPSAVQDCYKKSITGVINYVNGLIEKAFASDYSPFDEYGRFLNSYHFAQSFANSILNNNGYLNYLNDYYYKKMVSLYRYRLLDDNNILNIDMKETTPMFVTPRLINPLLSSSRDSLTMQSMLQSSYKGSGACKKPLRIPFKKTYILSKKLYIDIAKKDIANVLGIGIGNQKINIDFIKPVFFINEENDFFKTYRKRISKIYNNCQYDISDEYIKLKLDLDFYIPDNVNNNIYGYIEFRNFSQSLLDTSVSVPESYKNYLEKDSYGRVNQFTSFGDDREINYSLLFHEDDKNIKGIKCSAFVNDKGKVIIKVPKEEILKINYDVKSIVIDNTTTIK